MQHLAAFLVDDPAHAAVRAKDLATVRHHLRAEEQPSVASFAVDRAEDFLVALDLDQVAGLQIQTLSDWRLLAHRYLSRPVGIGDAAANPLEEVIQSLRDSRGPQSGSVDNFLVGTKGKWGKHLS